MSGFIFAVFFGAIGGALVWLSLRILRAYLNSSDAEIKRITRMTFGK